MKLQVVMNTQFGGFSICKEMSLWLKENANWQIIDIQNYDYNHPESYPVGTLIKHSENWYYPARRCDDLELRSDPQLIECVRHFHKLNEKLDLPYHKKTSLPAASLEIFDVDINISIEDVYDGKEQLSCWAYTKEAV